MMKKNRTAIILIALLVVLGSVLLFFAIRDNDKRGLIKRKTGYSLPSEYKIEKMVKYGSIFNRKSFEVKVRIDDADHMEQTIADLTAMLGDDHHEIPLSEYNITKYSLFSEQKLVPEPIEISWVITGPCKSGSLVCFLDVEEVPEEGAHGIFMYMYYNE
ncbi:MAG: hypothetical protein IKH92_01920 [Clostridiales bacterium]|nr:hypothetical protein [Clostridiales bacterium]